MLGGLYAQMDEAGRSRTDYAHPPPHRETAKADSRTPVRTTTRTTARPPSPRNPDGSGLTLSLGRRRSATPHHYDGDKDQKKKINQQRKAGERVKKTGGGWGTAFISFETRASSPWAVPGATFTDGALRIEYLDAGHLGTFARR
ncbi:hypothetical protein ACFSNO_28055 [Streptomyces cirratus]